MKLVVYVTDKNFHVTISAIVYTLYPKITTNIFGKYFIMLFIKDVTQLTSRFLKSAIYFDVI